MSEGAPQSPAKTSRSERLPSLKPKRDLTLGGIKKRVFTPTIPARRQKKATEDNAADNDRQQPTPSSTKSKDQRRDGKRDKQQRKKQDVITASSVFSMGPGERMIQTRKEMVQLGHHASTAKLSIKTEGKSSDHMLADDKNDSFDLMEIDPSSNHNVNIFMDSLIPPIKLPLNTDTAALPTHSPIPPKSKVKEESMDHDDTSVMDEEHTVVDASTKPTEASALTRLQVSDIFTPSEDSRGVFVLLQLPDCLPTASTDSDESTNEQKGTIRDVSEGMMGTIRVHASGAVKLVLGDIMFDITMGTRGGFLQELSSIRVSDPLSLTVLGHLSHRLVCVPDLLNMMNYEDNR